DVLCPDRLCFHQATSGLIMEMTVTCVVSRKKIAIPQRMSVWDLRGRCNNSVASNMLVYRSIGMFTDPEVTFTEAWESTCRSGPLTLRLSVNFALITILVACKAKSPGAVESKVL